MPALPEQTDPAPDSGNPTPRRFPFLLLAFLLMALCAGVYLAFLTRDLLQRRAFLERIQANGTVHTEVSGPKWIVRGLSRVGLGQLYAKYFNRITRIDYNDSGSIHIAEADMNYIGGLTSLRELYIWSDFVTDSHIAGLVHLTQLEYFALASNQITDEGLVNLKSFTALRSLQLECDQVTDEGLVYLKSFTALRVLRIASDQVTDVGIGRLVNSLTKLKWVSLEGSQLTQNLRLKLKGHPSLDTIKLTGIKKSRPAVE